MNRVEIHQTTPAELYGLSQLTYRRRTLTVPYGLIRRPNPYFPELFSAGRGHSLNLGA